MNKWKLETCSVTVVLPLSQSRKIQRQMMVNVPLREHLFLFTAALTLKCLMSVLGEDNLGNFER